MPSTARGESAPPSSPVVFTEEGFRVLLQSSFGEASPATTASDLAETLDVAPDTAIAWVYGLYATVLGRLPQKQEILPAANRLRSGETANGLVEELLASDEAMASGGDRPTDLGVAFITGCYLCVLGRRPDTSGLQHHLDFYASGGSPHVILEGMLESEEATSNPRFPPSVVSGGDRHRPGSTGGCSRPGPHRFGQPSARRSVSRGGVSDRAHQGSLEQRPTVASKNQSISVGSAGCEPSTYRGQVAATAQGLYQRSGVGVAWAPADLAYLGRVAGRTRCSGVT